MIYIYSGPFLPDLQLQYTTESSDLSSVVIKWGNPYPECFSFRVFVDGMTVGRPNETSFTVRDLAPWATHNVCVEAMDGHGNSSSMDCGPGVLIDMIVTCTLEPPIISSSHFCK